MTPPEDLEKLELMYLDEFYHFLKFVERRMLKGFATKESIEDDWKRQWDPEGEGKGISSFATGAERIVYSLFNSQGFGQPNSSPVGSDLFFETEDAFIHIDMKTVQTRNIGDCTTSIFVGKNQNSYRGTIIFSGGRSRPYAPALPYEYRNKGNPKPCLTYFVTILYDEKNLNILNINLISMPNGSLESAYGSDVLKAGKIPSEVRFNFSKASEFRLIEGRPKRVKVVYFDEGMGEKNLEKMGFIRSIYESQKK